MWAKNEWQTQRTCGVGGGSGAAVGSAVGAGMSEGHWVGCGCMAPPACQSSSRRLGGRRLVARQGRERADFFRIALKSLTRSLQPSACPRRALPPQPHATVCVTSSGYQRAASSRAHARKLLKGPWPAAALTRAPPTLAGVTAGRGPAPRAAAPPAPRPGRRPPHAARAARRGPGASSKRRGAPAPARRRPSSHAAAAAAGTFAANSPPSPPPRRPRRPRRRARKRRVEWGAPGLFSPPGAPRPPPPAAHTVSATDTRPSSDTLRATDTPGGGGGRCEGWGWAAKNVRALTRRQRVAPS